MNALKLYRRIVRLKKSGLSQSEIGAVCGIRQWTVSRLLRLEELTPAFTVFDAMKPEAVALHEAFPDNILAHSGFEIGDYAKAIRELAQRML